MTRLQSVADYERELAELDAMIESTRTVVAEDRDFASEMSLRSLERRRIALATELETVSDEEMAGHELDVVFNGKPVLYNRLEADFMGKVLLKIQGLVRSIAASGTPSADRSGPYPAEIKRVSELHFANAFAGSFGMRLEAIQEQPELDGFIALSPTLRAFLQLLEAGDNPSALLERLAEIGPRAMTHYEDLINELSSNSADMRVLWPNKGPLREVALRSTQATRVLETLRDVRELSSAQWYSGRLDISNKRHGRFGFLTDGGETFDGVVEEHLLDSLREFYDRHCRAWIVTNSIEHKRTGIVKKHFRLQGLEPLDEPTPP